MGEPNEVNKRHCTVTISLQIEILDSHKRININKLHAIKNKFRPHLFFLSRESIEIKKSANVRFALFLFLFCQLWEYKHTEILVFHILCPPLKLPLCYTDTEGATYDFTFGMNGKGIIRDERVSL